MSEESSVAVPVAPPSVGPVAAAPESPPAASPALDRILSMADHCLHDRLLRQASEMYFAVMDSQDGDSPESQHARRCLMEIAEYYERTGNPHQARGIYEQLL